MTDAPTPPAAIGGELKPDHVYVEVSGLTGTGKSAVMGEIEIALRALGLSVEHVADFQAEKNGTHADWQAALDLYKPTVVLRERNVSRATPPPPETTPERTAGALAELRDAVAFFDKVKAATLDERTAVGQDHWNRLEAAARAVAALSAPPATGGEEWKALSCEDQLALATRIAANVGYEVVPEDEHPDSPHAALPGWDVLPMSPEDIADAIWSDMSGRSGMDPSDIDPGIQDEIRDVWANIIRHATPSPTGGEAVAWRGRINQQSSVWDYREFDMSEHGVGDVVQPPYAAPPAPVEVVEALREAIDLLAERKYGSHARSPGHNARLVLEDALSRLSGQGAPQ